MDIPRAKKKVLIINPRKWLYINVSFLPDQEVIEKVLIADYILFQLNPNNVLVLFSLRAFEILGFKNNLPFCKL